MKGKTNTGLISTIGLLGLGAGGMYLMDRTQGRRRRALLRDKFVSLGRTSEGALDATWRNSRDRAIGAYHELRRSLQSEEDVPNEVLVQRVRSRIGRVVGHPRAIRVKAENGRIILSGPILKREVRKLVSAVRRVPGVQEVTNQLEVHESGSDVPALQGSPGRRREGERPEMFQTNWSPWFRAVSGVAGLGMASYGIDRGGAAGSGVAGAGLLLLARATTNLELKRLFGLDTSRRVIDIHKTITIQAPVTKVFNFWTHIENFPNFMARVKSARPLGGGKSHWEAKGPAGISMEWDAVLTRYEQDRVLAWKSTEGALLKNSGVIHFDPIDDETTRVDIQLSYNPPAGALGHGLLTLVGSNAKQALDEDLLRMKSLLEEGKASVQGQTVTYEELRSDEPHPSLMIEH